MARSMVRRTDRRGSLPLAASFIVLATAVSAQQIPDIDASTPSEKRLQLEVVLNGRSTNLVIPATASPSGELVVERRELEEAGVNPEGRGGPSEKIVLQSSGIQFRYDEAQQRIYFDLSDQQRTPKQYDGRGERPPAPPPTSSWGALLNYVMYASSSSSLSHLAPKPSGANASLDMRLFSPLGELTQTGIVGNTMTYDLFHFGRGGGLRLETTYTYVDADDLVAYRAGDIISGGLGWTRPVRLGGLQMQRNFGVRSDLVTAPLPSISGSAVVPSTVDVFVNGSKSFSQQVDEGPFRITNLPIATSGGNAQVVIRDASGRETRSEISLFSGQRMLAEGLWDFTLETGFLRRFYALRSNDYDKHPVGSGSFRYGLNDSLTLEGHAEAGVGVANGGVGAVAGLRQLGNVAFSLAASRSGGSFGAQMFASYSYFSPYGISLNFSTQRTLGAYQDLASRSALHSNGEAIFASGISASSFSSPSLFGVYGLPPRAVDRISIGAPALGGSASLALAQVVVGGQDAPFAAQRNSRLVTASYSRQLPFDGNLFVTAYANFSGSKDKGLFVGVSFPLGAGVRATLGAQSVPDPFRRNDRIGGNAQLQKSMGGAIGDYGWWLNVTQGQNRLLGGGASYRSSLGTARIEATQQGRLANGSAQFEGSVAIADMSVVPGPPVYDSFAVVSAGLPGVTVLQDNRAVGQTNFFGKMLVPNLRSYESNKVAIDPDSLPADAIPAITKETVSPMYRSGVAVDFGVKTDVKSVVLILTDPSGKLIETGSRGRLEGGDAFVVGYDGRAYVRGLSSESNVVVVDLGERDCRATFNYDPGAGANSEVKAECE
jgi:outer membrane usher protein